MFERGDGAGVRGGFLGNVRCIVNTLSVPTFTIARSKFAVAFAPWRGERAGKRNELVTFGVLFAANV